MDNFESILGRILAKHPDKKREQVLQMVEKRKDESNGLLSDLGAISLVAQQLLVQQEAFEGLGDQKIKTAHAGLNDVTISGEVVDISELREFPRQDGTVGKILRVRLSDASGQMSCALWDAHAEQLVQQGGKIGARLRLEHGYTKHGRGREVEFHLGNKGRFRLFEAPFVTSKPSYVELPWATIAEIAQRPGPTARRLRLHVRKLQGQQSTNGPATALCEDQTGMAPVKLWDHKIEEASRIGQGKTVIIGNPTTVERNGIIYVNVGRNSILQEDTETTGLDREKTVLARLKPGPVLHSVSGKIVERTEAREVETKEGRKVRVASVRLEDESGRVRVSLWDQHAERAESLRLGDTVKLIGVRVREGFNREVELSSVFLTEIEKTP